IMLIKRVWRHTNSGSFTVKSACEQLSRRGIHNGIAKGIWDQKFFPSVQDRIPVMNIELGEPSNGNVNGLSEQEAQQGNENVSVGVMPGEVADTGKVDVLEDDVERVGTMNEGDDQRVNDKGGVSANPDSVAYDIPFAAGTSLEVFAFSSPIVLPRISPVVNAVAVLELRGFGE
ncbi:unnamed protein product, partial [Ilex paraguariensis]